MTIFIQTFLIIIPLIGLIAGLSLGVLIPIFLLACLHLVKDQAKINLKHSKLEIYFTIWLILSCFWSIDILNSLFSFLKIFTFALVVHVLISNKDLISSKFELIPTRLSSTLIASILLFYFEYFTNGLISRSFGEISQGESDPIFYLHRLDRGCALIALFSWLVIAALIRARQNIIAILIYIVTAYTLYISDSLSAFVGFSISGIIFIITKFWPFHNPKIISSVLVICSILFVSGIYFMEPREISDNQAKSLPISAKHRLFIWDFALEKFQTKPFRGIGFNSSRKVQIDQNDLIEYENYKLSPLPSHPHNNLIQILLETGIIGFILYLALAAKYLIKWNSYFRNSTTPNMRNLRSAGYACFCTFFIISMISFNMWQSWWFYSYLWIATLFCFLIKEEE
jgi:O-antigen ligase